MKILQICPIFPPSPWNFSSGVTNVVYHISKELVKRGHEVTVYTSTSLGIHKKMNHVNNPTNIDGIEVYHFPYTVSYYTFCIKPSIIPYMKKNIKNFDIIHLHDNICFQSIICHYYAKHYDIPYILQTHGSSPRLKGDRKLKWLLDSTFGFRILRDATKVIALTKTEAEHLEWIGVSEDKIEIVPNGIDMSKYENLPERGEFRKKYSIKDEEKMILCLGRIHKIKGIDLLVEAFPDLVKELDDVRLVIVGGDSGFLPKLKRQIEDLKIGDKILFTGALYERDKLEAYVDADVYVLPSVYETFPVTVLEACACGTPVIITDRCGIADIVDSKVGYVVEYDKDQLRDAMINVLSDEGLRRKFGEEGRRLVREEFGWSIIIKQIEKIYEDATNEVIK